MRGKAVEALLLKVAIFYPENTAGCFDDVAISLLYLHPRFLGENILFLFYVERVKNKFQ